MPSYDLDVPDAKARNHFRLTRLTMDLGTTTIRKVVLHQLSLGGQTLHTLLKEKRDKMVDLFRRRIISDKQMRILYPDHRGPAEIMSIDITLWIVIVRNLVPGSCYARVRWDSTPEETQTEWYHDVLRIRDARNFLFHCQRAELDDYTFKDQWSTVTSALQRLDGYLTSFDSYLNSELDREAVRKFEQQVSSQVLQETNSRLTMELERRHQLTTIIVIFVVVVVVLVCGITASTVFAIINKNSGYITCDHYMYRRPTFNGEIKMMPRGEHGWGGVPPSGEMNPLALPAPYAIYTHTVTSAMCRSTEECCSEVRNLQYEHMHYHHNFSAWSDIAYHFLIDSTGVVYEGRSLNFDSAATRGWNNRSVSIALIGNYEFPDSVISPDMLAAFSYLLDDLVVKKTLTTDYLLYAMCEVRPTDSPGRYMYAAINSSTEFFPRSRRRDDSLCFFNYSAPLL